MLDPLLILRFAIVGAAAAKALLKGAKKSPARSNGYDKYIKEGTMKTALQQFFAVKPTDVRRNRIYFQNSINPVYILTQKKKRPLYIYGNVFQTNAVFSFNYFASRNMII